MSRTISAGPSARGTVTTFAVLGVITGAALVGAVVHDGRSPALSRADRTVTTPRRAATVPVEDPVAAESTIGTARADRAPSQPSSRTAVVGNPPVADAGSPDEVGAVTAADGLLPDGVSVFDERHPGVTNLDDDLLAALRDAATDAADEGVVMTVTSGWRSAAYQNQLLRDAVVEHGSEENALRWVATAETSAHVAGDAVDIGPPDAAAWLADHGDEFGLCQIYDNEPWHYERRPDAIESGCPPTYPDPTHDPRMQR